VGLHVSSGVCRRQMLDFAGIASCVPSAAMSTSLSSLTARTSGKADTRVRRFAKRRSVQAHDVATMRKTKSRTCEHSRAKGETPTLLQLIRRPNTFLI